MKKRYSSVSEFMEYTRDRNPNQPEFQQAVSEVIDSILPVVNDTPEYQEANILERLIEPDRVISFRVVWRDDDGDYQVNRGYRVQFNNVMGPYKGGLRFDPSVNVSVLKFLAFEQIFKNALTTLPLGAGKGGADFSPKGRSDREVMNFCHSFMIELSKYIGPNKDIPAGDIGVGAREIGYLYGQYLKMSGEFTGAITGKEPNYGGSLIRPEATGYGAVFFAQEMLQHRGEDISSKKAVISGSGNVALYAAEKLLHLGAKVVGLSDSRGFVHIESGINHEQLEFLKELKTVKRGSLSEFADKFSVSYTAGKRPWSIPCDMAFPCATQNELSDYDARDLINNGCTLVSEGANMPCTPEAISVFREKNSFLYGPGKAANAGGVAVSGLEIAQNKMKMPWARERVEGKLREIMQHIHADCVREGEAKGGVDYLKGANVASFKKVARNMLTFGVF